MTIQTPGMSPHNSQNTPDASTDRHSVDSVDGLGRCELLRRELSAAGVVLSVSDAGRLLIDAPRDVLTEGVLARVRADRDGLMALLCGPMRGVHQEIDKRPKVVHLKRDAFDVRIDRRSKWGNPFRIGPDGDRAAVIQKYRAWIVGQAELMAALPELHGKRLGCWCHPLPCHGDVLAELVAASSGHNEKPELLRSPSERCPWCGPVRLLNHPRGLRCDRCGRLAWVIDDQAITRADYAGVVWDYPG